MKQAPEKVAKGYGMRMAQIGDRTIIGKAQQSQFAHPWSVYNLAWRKVGSEKDADKYGWTLQILPGFVNGVDPLAYGIEAEGTANGGRGYSMRSVGSALNRVGGAQRERAGGTLGTGGVTSGGDSADWYPLLQGPIIPVTSFLAANEGRPVPPFFKEMNVKTTGMGVDGVELVIGDAGVSLNFTQQAGENKAYARRVMAQDFWIGKARASFSPQVNVQGNVLLGQLVQYSMGWDTTRLEQIGARPRIYQGDFLEFERMRRAQTALETRVAAGGPQDDGEDRILLFTLWLLEPDAGYRESIYDDAMDARLAAKLQKEKDTGKKEPDDFSQWEPYVEYGPGGWWNLSHDVKNDPPVDFGQFFTGLGAVGAFLGRYTIAPQATIGAMNAESNRILNGVFNEASNEGRFWT
jgi:hypothetical protein